MLRSLARLFVVIVLAFCSTTALSAQNGLGRMSGQVQDPDGNVISGASIQVINQDTLVRRETKTDKSGNYAVAGLPAGKYQVIVEAEGFIRKSSDPLALETGQTLIYNVKMSLGSVKAEVEVSGAGGATQIETNTATVSTTLGAQEVTGYGLNGRNFSQLMTMAPGVSNQTGQDEAKVGVAGSAKFSVNGGRVEYNTFEVDGSDVLNTSINASRGQGQPLMVYPSIDAIQDMKVLTANYSAVYGKSASGSVLVSTKSGSDKFHGNIYGFIRNEMFNARNYFDQPDPVPLGYEGKRHYRTPLYRRLDFGGTIGGPLFIPHLYNNNRQKTFFFFSEEIRREKTPVDYNQAVPTIAQRRGDFSDVCPTLVPGGPPTFDPQAYPDCPQGQLQGDRPQVGRKVAVNYTSQALLNTGLIPTPNSSTGCNTTNPTPLAKCYVAAVSPPTHWREELFRIDHNLTNAQRLSFRYVHDSWDTITLAPQWGVVQNSFPSVNNKLVGPGVNMAVILAQTLPHGFTNLFTASYEVEHITLDPRSGVGLSSLSRPVILDNPASQGGTPIAGSTSCSTFAASGISIPATLNECPMGYIFDNGYGGNKMPGLVFEGTNGAYGGHGFAADTGYAPWRQANPTYSLRDDASKIVGKHNFQFGVEGTYAQQNETSAVSGANSGDLQGLLRYSNQQSIYTSGNAFTDFLAGNGFSSADAATQIVGAIKSYTQDSGQRRYYSRYKAVDLYLQDDWRLTSRFTFNIGLRASFFGPWYNPKGTAYNWRPEKFDRSLGDSIYIDPNRSYLVKKSTGTPISLDRKGTYSLSSLDATMVNGLVQCGANSVPNSCLKNESFHPSPRIGFSWDPWGTGKTTLRAGYGLFWEHGTGFEANIGSLIGSAPLVLSETQSNIRGDQATGASPFNLIGYSCQGGSAQCSSGASSIGSATFPLNVTSIPTKTTYSYVQQWSFNLQREVRKGMVAQVGYVGTKGTHLSAVRDLNQLQPVNDIDNPFKAGQPITSDVCSSGANNGGFSTSGINSTSPGAGTTVPSSPVITPKSIGYINMFIACTGNPGFAWKTGSGTKLGISPDVLRPYPGFSNIISVENVADSTYNALQTTLRQTGGSLTLGIAYTYSHSIDDSSDRASANFANSLDIHSNRASSDFDQRHLLNVSYIYDLPILKLLDGFSHLVGGGNDDEEKLGLGSNSVNPVSFSPILKTVLGKWQLSGITTYQSGAPFSVINGGGSTGIGAADNAGVGNGLGIGSYADVIGKAHSIKPYVAEGGNNIGPLLLNPRAFSAPRGLTFGNSGRNYLSNPSRLNFNMSLFKHFKPFQERLDIEFRAEAFNVFNHTQFRITDPSHPGNTGNNIINCYGSQTDLYSAGASGCLAGNSFLHPVDAHDPRILQFGLKGSF